MPEICGYECDDDEGPFEGATCELSPSHDGKHRFTSVLEWDTRPIDVCREHGHVWGPWYPIQSYRQDISDVLMASLLPGLHLETIKEPTQERICERCKSYDNNGERRWAGPGPMPISVGQPLDRDFTGTQLIWVEDA